MCTDKLLLGEKFVRAVGFQLENGFISIFYTDMDRYDMYTFLCTEEHFSLFGTPGHVQANHHHHIEAARTVKIESLHGLFRSVLYVTLFGITIMTKTMTNKNHNDIMTDLFI